jgi:hypothetical protein
MVAVARLTRMSDEVTRFRQREYRYTNAREAIAAAKSTESSTER